MLSLIRVAMLGGIACLAITPVEAQSLFGESWGTSQRAARPTTRPPARRQPQSLFSTMDDDDEDRPRRGQRPAQAMQKGPPVQEGGPRPSISPTAPPVVAFGGSQGAGTVVIDTRSRSLYYVLGGGRAYRYGVAVGREGFGWTGTQRVSRMASWPDWRPPAEMRDRDPRLPELMTGGVRNPLGARAIYLGSTLYRIHGTNDSRSIGSASSSGCFRMTNSSVTHLSNLVRVGTTVQVVNGLSSRPPKGVVPDAATAARMTAERRG